MIKFMEGPIKIPLSMLYESLLKDYKNILIERGKDKTYIQELEYEIKMLKALKNNKSIDKELHKELLEYKKKELHINSINQVKSLSLQRDKYKLLWTKALTELNELKNHGKQQM